MVLHLLKSSETMSPEKIKIPHQHVHCQRCKFSSQRRPYSMTRSRNRSGLADHASSLDWTVSSDKRKTCNSRKV
ncbi:hypothetical protein QQP08_009560 [Theobroma cacao]|nr:hypothetical protein QQP08_009560 [Theobroma cacao]